MGRFSGMSKVSTGNRYFNGKGKYEVELGELIFKSNRKKIDAFIVETTVKKSDNPAYLPGHQVSQSMSFKFDATPRNIKGFVAAVMEIRDPDGFVPEEAAALSGDDRVIATDKWWEDASEFLVSEAQPCRGFVMHLETYEIDTTGGSKYTVHQWGEVISKPAGA